MDITPTDQTVHAILDAQTFYEIPRFQRPYSWEKIHVDDFWADSVSSDEEATFIGSFVVYKVSGHPQLLRVVDGQQRLTTITLLLAVLRDEFRAIGFEQLAIGAHRLIQRTDINNQDRFVLHTETPFPYFQKNIQAYDHDATLPKARKNEERNLEAAYRNLRGYVRLALDAVDEDPTISEESKAPCKRDKLLKIRDKLLALQLIVVTLADEDDAYLIFETLNTRGKDLELADMVKSYIARLSPQTNDRVDIVRHEWDRMREGLEEHKLDFSKFMHHFWLSRYKYLSKGRVYKALKRTIKKPQVKAFMKSIERDAQTYAKAVDPGPAKWTKQESSTKRSLMALRTFGVAQPSPFLLSILRDYGQKRIRLPLVSRTLASLENFHTIFTAVTSQRTGGYTAQMYAGAAVRLHEAIESNDKAQVLQEFIEKLWQRCPSYEEFEASFAEINYTGGTSKAKPVVQYLLERIDRYLRKGPTPNYDLMTIEHLGSRSPQHRLLTDDSVGMMGNLFYVDTKLNSERLKNKVFSEKRNILMQAGEPIDDVIRNASAWTDEKVAERTTWLATLLYTKILRPGRS